VVVTWREGLLELVGLVGVEDAEGVEVAGAAHLELDGVLGPLDPHRPRVLAPRRQQEVLDLVDLLRLHHEEPTVNGLLSSHGRRYCRRGKRRIVLTMVSDGGGRL
jgi:hypothetical protein